VQKAVLTAYKETRSSWCIGDLECFTYKNKRASCQTLMTTAFVARSHRAEAMVACKFHRYPARHIAWKQATMNTYLSLLRPAAGVFQVSVGWAAAFARKKICCAASRLSTTSRIFEGRLATTSCRLPRAWAARGQRVRASLLLVRVLSSSASIPGDNPTRLSQQPG
jgi:hypothetical protein